MKTLDQMSNDQLVLEADRLRTSIAKDAEQLQGLYQTLYSKVRRTKADDLSPSYIQMASAGTRFAGMVLQAARRTERFGRLLSAAKVQADETLKREAREKADMESRVARKLASEAAEKSWRERLFGASEPQGPEDDLIELYGEDT